MITKSEINPHGICTWQDESACADCPIQGLIKCRHNWGDLLAFYALFFAGALPAGIGMVRGGFGWWILCWFGYAMFFFNVWEAKILCSHCPYYARRGMTLVCLANHGCLKIWPYNPAPMKKSEKIQFLIGAILLLAFPLPFMIIGAQWLMLILTLVGLTSWVLSMQVNVCTRCVNFSCPVNHVPKRVVDTYLRRNPVMLKAWEESGYKVD